MKKKLVVIDFNGKESSIEYNTRNKGLLEGRLKNHSQVFKPKKGKGSFKRNKNVKVED